MTAPPRFRIGLRVADVEAARQFYEGLGFVPAAVIPDAQGRPVLAILEGHGVTLMADALEGLPFLDTPRERKTRRGPRGLGVVVGLIVDDLSAAYGYFRTAGCTFTSEPRGEPWGDRVFSALDPFGFEWEIAQPIPGAETTDGAAETQTAWFGSPGERP
jgi:catechol 2,3-dioxygenase-like lactoylglutathione lyase family enzyme